MVSVTGPSLTASFVYDGDGRRVKSIINNETILFIGAHFEFNDTTDEVTKYYFAGSSRIAMRKYTVPSSMEVEYLLGDHLGSTSITTDQEGTKVSEIRYKPWGEIRSSWTLAQSTTPAYTLSKYTFTGQFSYMDDPSTTSVTEGFGLMFYNARWYDPALGRFAQADTIIPGGVQGLDRYAYVGNSPVNYTDPSGHEKIQEGEQQDKFSQSVADKYVPVGFLINVNITIERPNNDDSDENNDGLNCPNCGLGLEICEKGGVVNCSPNQPDDMDLTGLPSTLTLHPMDSNVVSRTPIYDYSTEPPTLIGYRIKSYGYYDVHFSPSSYYLPSDAITWTSFTWTRVKPLLQPMVANAASLGIDLSCPVCGIVLATASTVDSLNSAITLDAQLRTRDVFFYKEQYLITPFDNYP